MLYHTLITPTGEYHYRSQAGKSLPLKRLYFAYLTQGKPLEEKLFRAWIEEWWSYEPTEPVLAQHDTMRWPES